MNLLQGEEKSQHMDNCTNSYSPIQQPYNKRSDVGSAWRLMSEAVVVVLNFTIDYTESISASYLIGITVPAVPGIPQPWGLKTNNKQSVTNQILSLKEETMIQSNFRSITV